MMPGEMGGGNMKKPMPTTGGSTHSAAKPTQPHMMDKKPGMGAMDHKAAIAKMHPEHVHKLVQMAHEGKMGPEAQGMAQKAMQGPAMQDAGASGMTPAKTNPFMDQEDEQEPQQAPQSSASMFAGGRSM